MLGRVLIDVRGTVQGVGFRPYVYSLATSLHLGGFVQHCGAHVHIDLEGEAAAIDTFFERLRASPPPRAIVEHLEQSDAALVRHSGFAIAPSCGAPEYVRISPDAATCDACLAEVFDAADRRFRYAFTTCAQCGPRFSIVTGVPYDRRQTTMRGFAMCSACQREYEDPANRRFHNQAIACPQCGPTLVAQTTRSRVARESGAVDAAVASLLRGAILAIKGSGGYQLACDATNSAAVARLRSRKRREAKPFAVTAPPEQMRFLSAWPDTWAALTSPSRPVVLIKRSRCARLPIAPNVAPGAPSIGLVLPHTPLHHVLLRDVGRPLVVTSGNRSGEPIACEDEDALERLGGVADLFLTHNQPIRTRCDGSVVRIISGAPTCVRRARGYAPAPLLLAEETPVPLLAFGARQKNTFCLVLGRGAHLSRPVGDLDNAATYLTLSEAVNEYTRLLSIAPEVVAHDLDPKYVSTRLASEWPTKQRLPIQHHHAHVLSCAAEHGVTDPLIGVAFDGGGLGTDGAVWGGEFLLVDGAACRRVAHLGYVALPGGEAAARQPWRMALAHACAAFNGDVDAAIGPLAARAHPDAFGAVRRMIARGTGPQTSSVGRLFDAVAAFLVVRDASSYDGQGALELEALAGGRIVRRYRFDLTTSREPWAIESAPVVRGLLRDLAEGRPRQEVAAGFHEATAAMVTHVAGQLARNLGIRYVALTGDVFQNALLTEQAARSLAKCGVTCLLHRRVPCNDGGLSLGQAVAAVRMMREAGASPRPIACA